MVETTIILTVVVSVEAVVFLSLVIVLILVYKFLKPAGILTNRSTSQGMITVQERGDSIYRDSTYSANLSTFGRQSFNRGLNLFGRFSFGRGTETFKKHQRAQQNHLNHQQEQERPLKEPSQSSSELLELQNIQYEPPPVEQEHTTDQAQIHQPSIDDSTD